MRRLPSTPEAKDKVFIDGFWSAYRQMCGILRKTGVVQLHVCPHVIENFYLRSLFLTDGILTRGFGSHQAVTGSFFFFFYEGHIIACAQNSIKTQEQI